MAHSTTFLGTLSKAFSRSTNAHHSSLCFPLYLSCNCLAINIASDVSVPGLNPNYILSISTACLNLLSRTLSATFIPCSSSLMPRDEPHSSTSPLPLYIWALVHSSASSLGLPLPSLSYYKYWSTSPQLAHQLP